MIAQRRRRTRTLGFVINLKVQPASVLEIRELPYFQKLKKRAGMQLKSIPNSVEPHKGVVYERAAWDPAATDQTLLITVRPRRGSQGYCSGCGKRSRTYDTMRPRRFQFISLWGISVFLVYAMRRIDCKSCGVTVEMVPWADGKKRITSSFGWLLATWAKRLSWKDTADVFQTSWDTVFRAVEVAVRTSTSPASPRSASMRSCCSVDTSN